ncbi:hypothetical protein [Nitrospirillum iridis]|uniref:Peptidase A1 domain-containing protein n=1 Tax=Nitrospirillum iridis TaxID=765888 RepID=A0A7X0AU47_9PROT|nr:hypothetical protein [Nitrospirillum iridis]MBB6250159.1 hypothetical protein [Nitrospirillum iridis]
MSTVTLTSNTTDFNGNGIHIYADIGASTYNKNPIPYVSRRDFQVDTGSSGIVVGLLDFNKPVSYDILNKYYPCFGPYTINYFPSDVSHSGYWYYMPVTLYSGTSTTAAATSYGMVLVCDGSVGMMGVSAKGENPLFNNFLQVSDTKGNLLGAGYKITTTGGPAVIIGQLSSTTDGFQYSPLSPATLPPLPAQTNTVPFSPVNTAATCWTMPPANLSITTTTSAGATYTLPFELDIGINQVMICMPNDIIGYSSGLTPIPSNYLPPASLGQYDVYGARWYFSTTASLTVNFPAGNQTPVLSYTWTAGSTPPQSPPSAAPTGDTLYLGPPNFLSASGSGATDIATAQAYARVNVGRCPLNVVDYIYDAVNGMMGVKKNS